MSNTLEFEGKNIEHAVADASRELNIPIDQIQYEVLTYGSTGIFGLVGVKKAKIRVAIKTPPQSSVHTSNTSPAERPKKTADAPAVETARTSEALSFGKETLRRIISVLSEEATIEAVQNGNTLFYMISGENGGVLIGKRGQTLEAIQYLVEKIVNKKNVDRFRVIIDVAGYLEKREANLKQLAQRLAEKAKKIKKPVTIGQMNAHDRRIVHMHLKDEQGIRTHSIGDGYYRKLMILPRKHRPVGNRGKN